MTRWWLLLAVGCLMPTAAFAFVATSTNYFVRQQLTTATASSSYPYSTSTNFQLLPGGGTALGTSSATNYVVRSGFINGFNTETKPVYTQTHYHWRNDDGSEAAATSKTSGTEDTALNNLAKSTTVRLRLGVSNEGGTYYSYATQQFRLEYGVLVSTCDAIGSWISVAAGGGDWDMADSTNLTEGGNTTNIAVGTGGVSDTNATFITSNGGVRDTTGQTDAVSVSSDSFIELEYAIAADAAAGDGESYCFRVTDAGTATLFEYDQYAQVTLESASLSFTVDSASQTFPALTPGSGVSTSSILYVTSGNNTGFNVTIMRDTGAATMALSGEPATTIPDKTNWSAPIATTTTGNSTASTTEPQTLQFRVRQAGTDTPNYASVWWGSADTTAAALFAGLPATEQTIINRSTAAVAETTSYVQYSIDVPATQKNGTYTGSITYTAVANP